ncbi:MAG: hypothetical protein ABJ275_06000 [Maricaulaceae bacterium]
MTQTYNIGGPGGAIRSILRMFIAGAALVGGLFFMAASAAVAFFLIIGLVILVAIVVAFLWARAKITGRPFGPKAYFKTQGFPQGFDFDAAKQSANADRGRPDTETASAKHGPIIDANETPDGWSVDG